MSNVFLLLAHHGDVFIMHVYSNLPLVVFFDTEVLVMEPEYQANWQHIRNWIVEQVPKLQEGRVLLGKVNVLLQVNSDKQVHNASQDVGEAKDRHYGFQSHLDHR